MYYTIIKIYRWFQYDKNDNLYPFWNSLTLILIVCHKKDYVTEISVLFVPKIALIRMSLKKQKSWIYIFMIQKKIKSQWYFDFVILRPLTFKEEINFKQNQKKKV